MMKGTRRGFLKSASVAVAGVALSKSIPAWASQAQSGAVQVWGTFRDKRHAPGEPLTWKPVGDLTADAIVIDAGAKRQEMLGFGAALTDGSCYVLSQVHDDARASLMHEFFAPEEMGLSVCRTCIGSSDYSRTVYSFDESEQPDPELTKFSIDHDKAYILPILRQARAVNPDLYLFSSPWSPPGWMKSNGSMLGGSMHPKSYDPYARYFVKFIEGYKVEGVTINAVTIQNEADTEQDGRMPACLWAQEHEIQFVGRFLGPQLRKAGYDTKIWVLDHNYNLWGRAIDELSDRVASEFIDGIAWHGYVGDASAMTRVHNAFPGKSAHWTEGGADYNQPDYLTNWTKGAETFNGILRNWAQSITCWNLALDEKGKPNVGPFSCGGIITVENGTQKVTRSGLYWTLAHYSRHVKRGAKVIATNGIGEGEEMHMGPITPLSDAPVVNRSAGRGPTGGVTHTGFCNPDGSCVVVLTNRGEQRRVHLIQGSQMLDVELPADSVQTLQWS